MGNGDRISSPQAFAYPEFHGALEAKLLAKNRGSYSEILRATLGECVAGLARQRNLVLPKELACQSEAHDRLHGLQVNELGAVYETYLGLTPSVSEGKVLWTRDRQVRRDAGVYYTPPAIVDEALKFACAAASVNAKICDAACGAGAFLVAGAKRLAAQSGVPLREVVRNRVYGIDLDPTAVELCRFSLWLESGSLPPEDHVVCADAILSDLSQIFPEVVAEGGFDVVVGNPPFGGVVEGKVPMELAALRKGRFSELGGMADLSSYFLATSLQMAKSKGRVALVMPRAFLSAPASSGLRNRAHWNLALAKTFPNSNAFKGACIHVCLVGYEPAQNSRPAEIPSVLAPKEIEVSASLTVGEAYALAHQVAEGSPGEAVKLVTSGLIDPGLCKWGEAPCRFLKKDYREPTIAESQLPPKRAKQVKRPKILIAGLSKTLECILDEEGEYVGSVGTYTLTHHRDQVSRLKEAIEFLHSKKLNEKFRRELGASALSGGNITLTKRFLLSSLAEAGF